MNSESRNHCSLLINLFIKRNTTDKYNFTSFTTQKLQTQVRTHLRWVQSRSCGHCFTLRWHDHIMCESIPNESVILVVYTPEQTWVDFGLTMYVLSTCTFRSCLNPLAIKLLSWSFLASALGTIFGHLEFDNAIRMNWYWLIRVIFELIKIILELYKIISESRRRHRHEETNL